MLEKITFINGVVDTTWGLDNVETISVDDNTLTVTIQDVAGQTAVQTAADAADLERMVDAFLASSSVNKMGNRIFNDTSRVAIVSGPPLPIPTDDNEENLAWMYFPLATGFVAGNPFRVVSVTSAVADNVAILFTSGSVINSAFPTDAEAKKAVEVYKKAAAKMCRLPDGTLKRLPMALDAVNTFIPV